MMEPRTSLRRLALLFAGWTLVALVFATVSYAAALGENAKGFGFIAALKLNLVQFYLWGIFSPLIFWFSRRFTIELRPFRLKNLLIHVPVVLGFADIHETIQLAILWSISPETRQRFASIAEYYRAYYAFGVYIGLIIASLIVIAVHALLYYEKLRTSELTQASLRAQLAQARLRALKMQLHPHFLFNTLHSISSLVLEDPPKANKMIARLGDFLRLTLDHSDQQLVTLKEEAEFLHCYLDIEQVRFGDRLRVTFDMEPTTLSALVPHLILQPVVENAIQHAVAPRAAESQIKIRGQRLDGVLRLEIQDNGPGMATPNDSDSSGVGLNNVRDRLNQIYGSDFRFQFTNAPAGGLVVTVEIPFQRDGGV